MTEIEAFIRDYAASIGMDPDVAVRAAMSEGGVSDPFRQSLAKKNGIQEPSYGPFQLLIGGPGTGYGEGVGNRALAAGIDPRKDWQAATRFAMDYANQRGWGEWYGPPKAGIGRYEGIAGRPQPKQYALNAPPDAADGPKGLEAYARPAPPLPPPYEVADRPIFDLKGDTEVATAAPPQETPTLAAALGERLGAVGKAYGAMKPVASSARGIPAARIDAPAPEPLFNVQQAEMQRQQLAQLLARLNSGRLA